MLESMVRITMNQPFTLAASFSHFSSSGLKIGKLCFPAVLTLDSDNVNLAQGVNNARQDDLQYTIWKCRSLYG